MFILRLVPQIPDDDAANAAARRPPHLHIDAHRTATATTTAAPTAPATARAAVQAAALGPPHRHPFGHARQWSHHQQRPQSHQCADNARHHPIPNGSGSDSAVAAQPRRPPPEVRACPTQIRSASVSDGRRRRRRQQCTV